MINGNETATSIKRFQNDIVSIGQDKKRHNSLKSVVRLLFEPD